MVMQDLKPYADMKDSGVPWLGRVPGHWEVLPNRALFAEVKDRDHAEEEMLSVTITKGVIRQKALLGDSSKKDSSNEDKSSYKLVCPGDIAYNKMRAWQGAIGVSEFRGIISPAYVVQRPRRGASPRYFHYLLRTPAFAKEAERWSYGITSDMWSLRPEHFKMIYGCLPSIPEQSAIVRFLDHVDRRIRKYIRAKQKLIALLEEQKQAIIHRAVTRGLDPTVRLKPSGVEWLGDIPEHWGLLPGLAVLREKKDKNAGLRETRVLSLSYGQIIIKPVEKLRGLVPESFETYQIVNPGEIIIRPTDLQNDQRSLRVGLVRDTGIITSAYLCLKTLPIVTCEYAYQLLNAYDVQKVFYQLGSGTRQNLKFADFKRLPILIPPEPEQVAIVAFTSAETMNIAATIYRATREISLLREYRTRLIADVVTGKLDVREAAANLPEEAEEAEAVEAADEAELPQAAEGEGAYDPGEEDAAE